MIPGPFWISDWMDLVLATVAVTSSSVQGPVVSRRDFESGPV